MCSSCTPYINNSPYTGPRCYKLFKKIYSQGNQFIGKYQFKFTQYLVSYFPCLPSSLSSKSLVYLVAWALDPYFTEYLWPQISSTLDLKFTLVACALDLLYTQYVVPLILMEPIWLAFYGDILEYVCSLSPFRCQPCARISEIA